MVAVVAAIMRFAGCGMLVGRCKMVACGNGRVIVGVVVVVVIHRMTCIIMEMLGIHILRGVVIYVSMIVARVFIAVVTRFVIFPFDVSGVLEVCFVVIHHQCTRTLITMETVRYVVMRVLEYWEDHVMAVIATVNVLMVMVRECVEALCWG